MSPHLAKPVPSPLRRWLREPLLHVLLIGAALFVVYDALNPSAGERQEPNRIVITADDLAQLQIAWMAQWQRPPTPDEMRNLLDGKIREEVLSREATALGLDKDDTIISAVWRKRWSLSWTTLRRCASRRTTNCGAGSSRTRNVLRCRAW